MNTHASPEEQRIAAEAAETPSLLDEKKFLEERRRRLEASLSGHVSEIRGRSQQAGKVVLAGAGTLLGVWLVAKAIGGLTSGRKRKKRQELKTPVRLAGLGPGAQRAPAAEHAPSREAGRVRPTTATSFAPDRSAPHADAANRGTSYVDESGGPRRPRPAAPQPAPEPAGPSLLQTFLESEAGRMMTNQLVALLMVFVTRKLENVLQIDRSADIASVKESDLTPYRIVDPVSDATVVPDEAAAPARSNAFSTPATGS